MSENFISEKYHVTGMGAALVDIYAHISDEELAALGVSKGSMTMLDAAQSTALQQKIKIEKQAAGGSVANTMAGIAAMGLKVGFIGQVGHDALGQFFTENMQYDNIRFASPTLPDDMAETMPTGHCLVTITPDAERTMFTTIGAAAMISADELDEDLLAQTACFFSEGYIFDSPQSTQSFDKACRLVQAAGGKIVLSLSDPFCVQRHQKKLDTLINTSLDMLLGNHLEFEALFATKNLSDIIQALQSCNMDAAITRSEKGAILLLDGQTIDIAAEKVPQIIDLTGAGDQFAAGLLSGLALGRPADICGRRGAIAAAEVIGHIGPRPVENINARFAARGLKI